MGGTPWTNLIGHDERVIHGALAGGGSCTGVMGRDTAVMEDPDSPVCVGVRWIRPDPMDGGRSSPAGP
jgi:hypothetical protein